jgi:hypothetical protein
MFGQLAPTAVLPSNPRVAVRHACEVPTTCQPLSAWRKEPWPATIRGISTGGLNLTLGRRFERGSGLSIELPTEDGRATVLARVNDVSPHDEGGWLLGCDFISELSDEEVECVLGLDPLRPAPVGGRDGSDPEMSTASISGVLFHVPVSPGEYLRWYVKRLDVSGDWPLPVGGVVTLRVGDAAGAPVELRVEHCRLFGSYWVIECKLISALSEEMLRILTCPPPSMTTPRR